MNYPRAMISFILTPKGPCVDGSTAPTKQIDYSVEDLQQGRYLVNFPYAYYRLTAVLMTALGGQNNCLHFLLHLYCHPRIFIRGFLLHNSKIPKKNFDKNRVKTTCNPATYLSA